MTVYIVRIKIEDGDIKIRAYMKRPDAEKLFNKVASLAMRDEIESCAWYEVSDTDDVRVAHEAVETADKSKISLLGAAPQHIYIDLEELGL